MLFPPNKLPTQADEVSIQSMWKARVREVRCRAGRQGKQEAFLKILWYYSKRDLKKEWEKFQKSETYDLYQ